MNEKKYEHSIMNIQSDQDIMKAMEFMNQYAHSLGFLQNDPLFLTLAVEESLMNALEFGQGNEVMIEWIPEKEGIVIRVMQQGSPYTIEKKEEVNKGSRGRGMQLILNIMDKVWLEREEDNITLCMKKNFPIE